MAVNLSGHKSYHKGVAATLGSLPFDIVFEILRHLAVQDIVHIAQTSRQFWEFVSDHAVWASRESDSLTMFPSTSPSTLSTAELRRKITRDAIIESRWKGSLLLRNPILRIHPPANRTLQYVELLPGGECLLGIYGDGALDLIDVESAYGASTTQPGDTATVAAEVCDFNQLKLLPHRYKISASSEYEGYLILELCHCYADPRSCKCDHVSIYSFNARPGNSHIKLLTRFLVSDVRQVRSWERYGLTFSSLYEHSENAFVYVSMFEVYDSAPPLEACFQLSGLEYDDRGEELWTLAMISNRRLIVAGPKMRLSIFDVPEDLSAEDRSDSSTLTSIWSFTFEVGDLRCGPIFYRTLIPHKPMIWIAAGNRYLYHFVFSHGAIPVETQLKVHLDEHPHVHTPSVGFSHAVWKWNSQGSIRGRLLSLVDITQWGSFEVPLDTGIGWSVNNNSFDQFSGRILFTTKERSKCSIIVFDTVL